MQSTNTDNALASQGSPHALDTIPSRPKTLCEMPEEVLMHIGLALPCREFGRFLQTNRQIHDCLDTHYVWHQRFTTRFGQPILQSRLRPAFQTSDHSSSPQSSSPPSPRFPPNTSQGNLSSSNSAEGNSGDQRLSSYFSHHQHYNNHHNNQDPQHSSTSHSGTSSPFGLSRSSSPTPEGHGVDRVALPSGGGSSGSSSSDDEQDDEAAKRPAKPKGKGRKIDLRKTTKASKELLIELYQHYSRMTLPAEDMAICHMGDRYWIMIDSASSSYGKLAELRSVWWMDVVAVFYGVPPGRYKVQWRVKVTSDAPVVNSEFKSILFDKHEEFTQHTDSQVMKADRKPFRNLFKGFTILELPGELVVEDDFQGVFLQIRNYEGWKSGLYVDYARLVDLDDPERSKDRLAASTRVESALDEEVNDEGEEYYPTSDGPSLSWLQNLHGINPLTFRSRGFRQYNPVNNSTPLDVGAGSPSAAPTLASESAAGAATASSSSTTTNRSRANGDGEATELPDTCRAL
ncbi:hypothetical protein BGZ75_003052 [Mortierella antarctica]|nr:hypothetical protein BGZ75_003052 [Mortierella antarctica]